MRGTNIYYLSGLTGSTDTTTAETVWMGNDASNYTAGKMALLSKIDLLLETANITKDTAELAIVYNQLDLYATTLHGYESIAKGERYSVALICKHIAGMNAERLFFSTTTDLQERAERLTRLQNELEARFQFRTAIPHLDDKLFSWLKNNVVEQMQVHISGRGKQAEVAENIKQSGVYYIGRYLSNSQIKRASSTLIRKRNIQNKTFHWVRDNNRYFDENSQNNLIRAGIIRQTQMTPEQCIRYLSYKSKPKVGSISLATIYTAIQVITLIAGIISKLIDWFGKKRNKPSVEEMERGLMQDEDFKGLLGAGLDDGKIEKKEKEPKKEKPKSDFFSKNIPTFAGAGLLFFLIKKTKKQ